MLSGNGATIWVGTYIILRSKLAKDRCALQILAATAPEARLKKQVNSIQNDSNHMFSKQVLTEVQA